MPASLPEPAQAPTLSFHQPLFFPFYRRLPVTRCRFQPRQVLSACLPRPVVHELTRCEPFHDKSESEVFRVSSSAQLSPVITARRDAAGPMSKCHLEQSIGIGFIPVFRLRVFVTGAFHLDAATNRH